MYKTLSLAVLLALSPFRSYSQEDFPELKGPYIGQKPPGTTAERFAPGVVSIPDFTEWAGTFSPDGNEYYFYRFSKTSDAKIFSTKVADGKWTQPQPVAFAEGYFAAQPHITLDNKRLYFGWQRPLPEGEPGDPKLPRIWVAIRMAR